MFWVQTATIFYLTVEIKFNAYYAVCKAGLHAANQHEKQEFRPGLETVCKLVAKARHQQ